MDITELFNSIIEKKLDRREFFQWLGRVSVFMAVLELIDGARCGYEPKASQQPFACMQPQTDDEKTIYAMCDTILPGTASDPTGAPGAVDVCTMELVYDKFYGVAQSLPPVLLLVNSAAQKEYGKKLYDLNLGQRTAVLKNVESMLGIIDQVYMFMKGPFYIGMTSRLGLDYMGDPGPNLGYVDHNFSFYAPMSKEMTSDGNLP